MNRKKIWAGIVFGSISIFIGISQSQDPLTSSRTLQLERAVIVKLIQVYVTDRDGNPVMDLSKDDFTVLDDGKSVVLTEFERHDLRLSQTSPATSDDSPLSKGKEPSELNRKFFLIFDFAFNNQMGVSGSLKAALHFLDTQIRPGDEIAVLSMSTRKGITIHEFLTSDHAKARLAVAALTSKDLAGRAEEIENEYWRLAGLSQYMGDSAALRLETLRLEGARRQSKFQTLDYITAFTDLAKAFRLVPGQKSFLLFSSGIPSSLIHGNPSVAPSTSAAETVAAVPDQPPAGGTRFSTDMGDTVIQPLFAAMLKEFNSSGCSFFAFDTRESAKLTQLFGYDDRGFELRLGGFFSAGAVGSSVSNPFQDDKTTGMDTLKTLSKRTGGKYFSNIGLYEKNLTEVQNTTGAYYVLGYPISTASDGKYHALNVVVKGKRLQVRAPGGYFNPKPFLGYSKLERDIHLFDLALNRRSEFLEPSDVPLAYLAYEAGEGPRLRIISRLSRQLMQEIGGDSLEFVSLILDDQENVIGLQQAVASQSAMKENEAIFSSGFSIKPGSYKCRLVVRNLVSGKSAVGSIRAFVPKRDRGMIALCSPLLLVAGPGPMSLDGTVKGNTDDLKWRDIYPYDPTTYSPYVSGLPLNTDKFTMLIPISFSGPEEPRIQFVFRLVDLSNGTTLPIGFQELPSITRKSVTARFWEIIISNAPAGEYALYVSIADSQSGQQITTNTRIMIGP